MNRFTNLFSRRRHYDDISTEIREYLDEKVEELVATGMSRPEAIAAARRQFGNVTLIEQRTREVWQWSWLDNLFTDIRYALRTLRKSPGFTAVAILTLALGIGANTAIFSVVNAVLFRELPYRDPGRLVWATNFVPSQKQNLVFENIYAGWRTQNDVFENIAAYSLTNEYTLSGAGTAKRLQGATVTRSFLEVLGVTPQLGRNFLPEEDRADGPKAVMLSDVLWRSSFESDPNVVGRVIALDDEPYTVVGVLPRNFEFLDNSPEDLLVPFQLEDSGILPSGGRVKLMIRSMEVVARLRPGATPARVATDLNTINERVIGGLPANLKRLLGDRMGEKQARVFPLHDHEVGNVRPALLMLMGAVGFVLLVACANVASLQLARAAGRETELAVRGALGAGRWRLARLLLTESSAVALAGGASGVALAAWGIRVIRRLAPANIPHLQSARLDWGVLAFALGVSLATGILSGLAPVLAAFRASLNDSLKEGTAHAGGGTGARRIRGALVVAEIALSLVLFICAVLLAKSFRQMTDIQPGFDPHGVLTAQVALPLDQYQSVDQQGAFFERLVARIQALPGVDSAGATALMPLRGDMVTTTVQIEGRPPADFGVSNPPSARINSVTPGYFAALRVSLIEGRFLDERDAANSPFTALVNQTFVRRYFPTEDPIDKRVSTGLRVTVTPGKPVKSTPPQTWQIVGVIGDTKQQSLASDTTPEITVSASQWPRFLMALVVRTSGDPLSLTSAVRTQVSDLDKNLPVYDVQTMDEMLSAQIASQRFNAGAVAGFAGLAVLLAGVGIYGVMAYTVTQRTHEFGVRIALGAAPGNVLRMVLSHGLRLVLIGVALGLGASLALTRLMTGLLFGVRPTDIETFTLVTAALIVVALTACLIPAHKAMRVDPIVALRHE
jgi:predicted permease